MKNIILFLMYFLFSLINKSNYLLSDDHENDKRENKLQKKFAIYVSSNLGGNVIPKQISTVLSGEDFTLKIRPIEGYTIDNVILDYNALSIKGDLTIPSVDANHNIYVSFKKELKLPLNELSVMSIGAIIGWDSSDCKSISIDYNTARALKKNGGIVNWQSNNLVLYDTNINETNIVKFNSSYDNQIVTLDGNGNLATSKSNQTSNLEIPNTLSGISDIAIGSHYALVLKNDGTIISIKKSQKINKDYRGIIGIATFGGQYALLSYKGEVFGWNILGNKITVPNDLKNVITIACGKRHMMALKNDGTVVAWEVELTSSENEPAEFKKINFTKVPEGLNNVIAIAAGDYHCVALKRDGSVTAWGINDFGQTSIPIDLPKVKAIAAGGRSTMFLFDKSNTKEIQNDEKIEVKKYYVTASTDNNGDIYPKGEIRIEEGKQKRFMFVPNSGFEVDRIFVDGKESGTNNEYLFSNVNSNHTIQVVFKPKNLLGLGDIFVTDMENINLIGVGSDFAISIDYDGKAALWERHNSFLKKEIELGIKDLKKISIVSNNMIGLRKNDELFFWGNLPKVDLNIIKNNTNISSEKFTSFILNYEKLFHDIDKSVLLKPELSGIIDLAVGSNGNIIFLKHDGTVEARELGVWRKIYCPIGLNNVISVAAGAEHFVALKNDGTVTSWPIEISNNEFTVSRKVKNINFKSASVEPPEYLNEVIAIAAGDYHTIALKKDGKVIGWGNNYQGQIDIPNYLLPVKKIAAYGNSTLLQINTKNIANETNNDIKNSIASEKQKKTNSIHCVVEGFGEIFPSGNIKIETGKNATFAFIPKIGSKIDSILIDNKLVVVENSYTFNNVTTDHKIQVNFKLKNIESIGEISIGDSEDIIDFAVSSRFTATLNTTGVIDYWEKNSRGTKTIKPWGLSNIVSIAIYNGQFSCLNKEGDIFQWTYDNNSTLLSKNTNCIKFAAQCFMLNKSGIFESLGSYVPSNFPPNLNGIVDFAACSVYILALRYDGTVVLFNPSNGQKLPVPKLTEKVVSVALGLRHAMALLADGTVINWQINDLSDNKNKDFSKDKALVNMPSGLKDIIAISAGDYHSVALKKDGSVVAWGFNDYGQIDIPKDFPIVKAIKASGNTTLFLLNKDKTKTFKNLESISVNKDEIKQEQLFSILSSSGENGTIYPKGNFSFSSGENKSYIIIPNDGYTINELLVDGIAVSNNMEYSFLKINTAHTISVTFKSRSIMSIGLLEAGNDDNILGASVAMDHILAYKKNGSVVIWRNIKTNSEILPLGLTGIIGVASNQNLFASLTASGKVITWDRSVSSFELNAIAITFLGNSLIALRNNGTMAKLGDNTNFLGNISGVIGIAGGKEHILCLIADGTVLARGANSKKQLNIPEGLTDVVSIVAGDFHSVVLKKDGTVVTWGDNSFGQLNVPEGLSDVVSIAAGAGHSIALKKDGTVIGWGNNNVGQIDIPKKLPPIRGIFAGGDTTVFLFKE